QCFGHAFISEYMEHFHPTKPLSACQCTCNGVTHHLPPHPPGVPSLRCVLC
ncbi:hypothetical protein B0F90DRAFT_1772779, partial [Multifurca ochricompacta]